MTWVVIIILGSAFSMPVDTPEACFAAGDDVIAWARSERLRVDSVHCQESSARPERTRDLIDWMVKGDA